MINGITNFGFTPRTCCPTTDGCPCDRCPDFQIKQHDTLPVYRLSVNDCNGPIDLTNRIAEVSMWALGKFRKSVAMSDDYFALADNIGFYNCTVGDLIVVDQSRNQEQMLITGFDETNKLIQVQRGYGGTVPQAYAKGQKIKIFRILNAVAETKVVTEDQTDVNTGNITFNVVTDSQLIYTFTTENTCISGCYWLEFKLLKMASGMMADSPFFSMVPSNISFISDTASCTMPVGILEIQRFPSAEAFLVKINSSPTSENLV